MLFLSHSSLDKPAVTELAFDLLVHDVPVWLDEWEIEAGDSLLQRIEGGIGESSYLALLLSPRSVASEWVAKEIELALEREARDGRKFLLPIVLESCEIPAPIAGRVHVDLSRDYTANLERLTKIAARWGINGAAAPWEQQIIPLRFTSGLYLDEPPLEARLATIAARRPEDAPVAKEQILVIQDEHYTALRRHLQRLLDATRAGTATDYESRKTLQELYSRVRYWEDALVTGVQIIFNALLRPRNGWEAAHVAHYFALLARAEALTILRLLAPAVASVPAGYAEKSGYPFEAVGFMNLFGVRDIATVHVEPEGSHDRQDIVSVWCDGERDPARSVREWGGDTAASYWAGDFLYKFLLPQMVYKHIVNGSPLYWRPDSLVIG